MLQPDLLAHNIFTQGFYVVDDFLDLKDYMALRLKVQLLHEQGLLSQAKIGKDQQVQQNKGIRSDATLWLDEDDSDASVQAYLQKTKKISTILNQTLYLGLQTFETHFAVYEPGSFYKMHVDQFAHSKERKISCVYYLNNEWHPDLGGELKLYSPELELLRSIAPQGNRFICFNSELPHEVCITKERRYSIAGWMKTRSMVLTLP